MWVAGKRLTGSVIFGIAMFYCGIGRGKGIEVVGRRMEEVHLQNFEV